MRSCYAGSRGKVGDACHRHCRGGPDGSITCDPAALSAPLSGYTTVDCYAEDGLYCGPESRCVALLALGEACNSHASCPLDASCATGATGAGTCVAKLKPGQLCRELVTPCVDGAYCSSGLVSRRRLLAKVTRPTSSASGSAVASGSGLARMGGMLGPEGLQPQHQCRFRDARHVWGDLDAPLAARVARDALCVDALCVNGNRERRSPPNPEPKALRAFRCANGGETDALSRNG